VRQKARMEINHEEKKRRKNQNPKMGKRSREKNQKNPKNRKRNRTKAIKQTLIPRSHYLYQVQRRPLLRSPQTVLVHQWMVQKSMNSRRIAVPKNRLMTNYDRLFYIDLTTTSL